MKIYSPTCTNPKQLLPIAPRRESLAQQVWGFVDTSKVNADLFIEEMKLAIQERYQPRGFVAIRKEAPGLPLTPGQTEQLAAECGVVVFCFGD